jgi:hypothetical protein
MRIIHRTYEDRVLLINREGKERIGVYTNGVLFICQYSQDDKKYLRQLVKYMRNPKRIRVFEGVREPNVTKISLREFRAMCDNGVSAAVLLRLNINTNFIEEITL